MSETKTYIIKEGNHSSGLRISPYFGYIKDIQKRVTFCKCAYEFSDADQQDWNKLFGMNIGFAYKYFKGKGWLAKNKVQFAWRYNVARNAIELAWFAHINYEQHFCELITIPMCNEFILRIQADRNAVLFSIYTENKGFICSDWVNNIKTLPFGHYLFPYFGGNKPAQNDVIITMKDIKEL